MPLRTLHLFSGAGGGILCDILLGHQPVCAVEIEPYCQQVLHARQKDGFLPWFPIFDDVKTFDGKPWRGLVEVVAGGFPCQDISSAGKGAGIGGARSGLWGEMRRIIGEVRPKYAIVENSPMLTIRGGTRVSADLACMGYVGHSGVLSAADAIWLNGTPCADHLRERMWFIAQDSDSNSLRQLQSERSEQNKRGRICDLLQAIPNAERQRLKEQRGPESLKSDNALSGSWWSAEPGVCRVADGVASRVDRLKAIGNGQVPQVAALAWRTLSEGII
jgi:DNA (cytosine-5)-methyltransferase 1